MRLTSVLGWDETIEPRPDLVNVRGSIQRQTSQSTQLSHGRVTSNTQTHNHKRGGGGKMMCEMMCESNKPERSKILLYCCR